MLNISVNKLNRKVDLSMFESGKRVMHVRHYKQLNRFILAAIAIALITLFLPWTQTVSGKGFLTTLRPDQRPQTIQSPIPGRIEQWYVREGDYVNKGDTILHISEVKNEYFDPDLISRAGEQLSAKSMSVNSYGDKVDALMGQVGALEKELILKTQQARNKLRQSHLKVASDSIELEAAKTQLTIAQRQFDRVEQLQAEGLKAVTDLEDKRLKLQESQAKLISRQNNFMVSKNEVLNASMEINRVNAEYSDKIWKAKSEMFTAQSGQFDAAAQVSKLENEITNYEIRNDLRYIRAPQSGFVNKTLMAGIGETIKEGTPLVSIMPADYERAVETFIRPIDLPLIHKGEQVRIQFDGWPAIVFSGWPNLSYGTYGGIVVAIETFISENGNYRVILAPDPQDQPWPEELRVGSGASTIALLEDVPIWFEIWRQLNGFPPNYYKPTDKPKLAKATDNE
jgi:multidrug resistance efflux pump